MKPLLTLLFACLGALNIVGQIYGHPQLTQLSKAMLMPSLFLLVYLTANPSSKYLWALFFSWLGDLFLIPNGTPYFITGIACFWLTQIGYCHLILKRLKCHLGAAFKSPKGRLPLLILTVYLLLVVYLMIPRLENLLIPVMLYATTLAITGYLGFLLALEKKTLNNLLLAAGALLFVLSDSMIAFDAFYFSEKQFGYWVMITYIPAQFLISKNLAVK